MPQNALFSHATREPEGILFDPENPHWAQLDDTTIDRHWNGRTALSNGGSEWANLTRVRSSWNEDMVLLYFKAWFKDLNVEPECGEGGTVGGLWNKDLVEVFLGPSTQDGYYEVQASPLGQWSTRRVLEPRTREDTHWNSGLKLKVVLSEKERLWHTFLGLPWNSFGTGPPCASVTAWPMNLFRIAGPASMREYLAWRPTFTKRTDFHVPASFGYLLLLGE